MKPFRIAIIGLGPKGLYALERLVVEMTKLPATPLMELHLFERSGRFGSGTVYNPDQPGYLIMNYPNHKIDVRYGTEHSSTIPDLKNLLVWSISNGCREALSENAFSPRRTVGKYLASSFKTVVDAAPDNLQIYCHHATVTGILETDGALGIGSTDHDGKRDEILVDRVMLTSGHCSWKGKLETEHDPSGDNPSPDVPFVYPLQKKLARIRPTDNVAIKGLGLTFIDTVLALTEGRGGRFERANSKKLIYLPSNREPVGILGFSRSGLPMVPRSGEEGKDDYRPRYFDYGTLMDGIAAGKRPNFIEHVLPLLVRETTYRYYKTLFAGYNMEIYTGEDYSIFQNQTERFHTEHPHMERFDFGNLFRPVSHSDPSVELEPLAYLQYLLGEAGAGSLKSPFMAAALTWGKISDIFCSVYNFGGMTPESHWLFDNRYRSRMNRISYGPPLSNMEKMVALMEAGLLNMDYSKNPEIRKSPNGWKIKVMGRKAMAVDFLVDARIPTNRSVENWSPLLRSMKADGLVREFMIRGTSSYRSACPEIEKSGNVVRADGSVSENITLYGTPTEGMTFDNDTLSRKRNDFAAAWALGCIEASLTKHMIPK